MNVEVVVVVAKLQTFENQNLGIVDPLLFKRDFSAECHVRHFTPLQLLSLRPSDTYSSYN